MQGVVLGDARRGSCGAQAQQRAQAFRRVGVGDQLVDSAALQVVEAHVVGVVDVSQHRVALVGAHQGAVSQALQLLCEARLRLGDSAPGGLHQVEVDRHAPVVDRLVEDPEPALVLGVVPARQAPVDLAHGLDVEARVIDKLLPLVRVRAAAGAGQLVARRLRLAE